MLEINGTIIVFALSFIIFVFLLDKALWQPIRRLKEARAEELALEIQNALKAEERTKALIEQIDCELDSIKNSEHKAIESLFAESKLEEAKQEEALKQELENLKTKAYQDLKADHVSSVAFIEEKSLELAHLIVAKVAPELREGAKV